MVFKNSITAAVLIKQLTAELDTAPDIPLEMYAEWLNTVEQLVYTEIIAVGASCTVNVSELEDKSQIELPDEISTLSDVYRIEAVKYADDDTQSGQLTEFIELKKLREYSRVTKDYWRTIEPSTIELHTDINPTLYDIHYRLRPKLHVAEGDIISGTVSGELSLPDEFTNLYRSYIRGEAYKLANEFDVAANWINDYNQLLESFRQYIAIRQPLLQKGE